MLRRAAWGVDLTGGAVQAVHVERRGREHYVLDVLEEPFAATGESSEPLRFHLPDGCDRALHGLLNGRRGTLGDPVFVALPVFGARHGFIALSVQDPQRATALFDFELHQALGGDLSPWAVRVGPFQPIEGGLAAPYFAQRRDAVASFLEDVRRVGLPVDGLVPGPLALARYARSEWPAPGCQLILQVQRTRTDLVYVTPERTRFRTVPFGCGMLKEPEFLPRNPARDFEELAARLVREHLAARNALFGGQDGTAITKIHLLGDGARHAELRTSLSEQLHTEVVVPHLGRHVHAPRARTPEIAARALQLGTALGLALGALSPDGDEASLVPPPADRRSRRRLPALTSALLVISLGLLALRLLLAHDVAQREGELARQRARVTWGTQDDLAEATRVAKRESDRVHELVAKAASLRRQVGFPERLLDALQTQTLGARLVALSITPGVDHDDATMELELPNATPGAVDRMRAHLEAHVGVTIESADEKTAADGTVDAVLHAKAVPFGEPR